MKAYRSKLLYLSHEQTQGNDRKVEVNLKKPFQCSIQNLKAFFQDTSTNSPGLLAIMKSINSQISREEKKSNRVVTAASKFENEASYKTLLTHPASLLIFRQVGQVLHKSPARRFTLAEAG